MSTQALLDTLRPLRWHYLHKRQRMPFYTYLLWEGSSRHHNQRLQFSYPVKILYLDSEIGIEKESWDLLYETVSEQQHLDPGFLLGLLHDSYVINQHSEELARSSVMVDLELGWKQYLENTYLFGSYALLPLFVENDMEAALTKALSENFSADTVKNYFQLLTTPVKPSATQEEARNLLVLATRLGNGEEVKEGIREHLQRFSWIQNNSFNGNFTTYEEVSSQINELGKNNSQQQLADFDLHVENHAREVREIRAQFESRPEIQFLIDTLQESIYFRSWRTERYYRIGYLRQEFFARTAQKLALEKVEDIFYLTPPEIMDGLAGKVINLEVIDGRKKGYSMWADGETVQTFTFPDLAMIQREIQIKGELHKDLKGQCAFGGYVQGRVRVVTEKRQLEEVQDGEILVTTSTTPDYVPVLRRVSGIITDEGGVLSHASIISRELKIPCIIGTRQATRLLVTGDLVEMDAQAGIIKKI